MYELKFTPAAVRNWRKLTLSVQERIAPHFVDLASESHPSGVKKLKGFRNLYRIRIGDYRVVYQIDDSAHILWVTKIEDRKDVY